MRMPLFWVTKAEGMAGSGWRGSCGGGQWAGARMGGMCGWGVWGGGRWAGL
jgi:hypothetical protein